MRILITGAGGFVGQSLATTFLNDEQGKYEVILTDIFEPPVPANVKWPAKATSIKADLLTDSAKVIDKDLDAAYVFHGIMSSGSESDFELGMRVNLDATRAFFDTLRVKAPGVKVIYTSSQAVYGGKVEGPITETLHPTPESSYGAEKTICEYLLNDYTRRGFLNGWIVRLPTISVRAGKPTAAASSFLSGMIREPMQGIPCVLPLRDRAFTHCLSSPSNLLKNLVHALSLPDDALPKYDRAINLPGIRVTVQDMLDSLARVGGEDKLKYISEEDDEACKAILYTWLFNYDYSRALNLGFTRDDSFDDIVREFKEQLEAGKA
ncbi:putative nucleoside-diphosphate-sugar epimerase [Plectosphaerella plurivora]|uniref:Nucleoside-diphosphate-sugar epimerase n=1 Tax=Plectosphaerella plurivora TaxID=936078 RepID=A0A9P8V4S3_9PEZI|nr:putative nucleoside-diphosphate-sugar epimerase [Plectosphaerella plurivora]